MVMPPGTPVGALIGRDGEIALLTGLMRDVARGRTGGSVLIEGELGIGKSAMVRAALTEAPEAGCQVFWGAGDELSQALPLHPFLDGLRVREPSTNPRRDAIVRLNDETIRLRLAEGALSQSAEYRWDLKARTVSDIYYRKAASSECASKQRRAMRKEIIEWPQS